MALYDDYLAQNKSLLDYYAGLRGTSTGLSPETYAGLQTNALETVPAQLDRTESELATQLQRQNPTGLPMGGEFLRAYAPLEAAKESTRAGLLRDLMLQNEAEKRRTLDLNNQYALSAAGQFGNLGTALLGDTRQQQQFEASQGLTREQNELNRQNAIRLAEIANQPGSFKNLLLSSLLGAAATPNPKTGDSLITKGIGAVIDAVGGLFGGGKEDQNAPNSPVTTNYGGQSALPALGAAAATGGKALLGALGAIPVAGQVAAGIAGGILLGKKVFGIGDTHKKANEWVQSEQNQFDTYMADIDRNVQAGTLGPDIAAQMRTDLIRQYVQAARDFAAKGKDQRRVIDQAFETLRQVYGPYLQQAMVNPYIDTPEYLRQQGWF